jgi:hypothetical protein
MPSEESIVPEIRGLSPRRSAQFGGFGDNVRDNVSIPR